jgi:hypothetical protein
VPNVLGRFLAMTARSSIIHVADTAFTIGQDAGRVCRAFDRRAGARRSEVTGWPPRGRHRARGPDELITTAIERTSRQSRHAAPVTTRATLGASGEGGNCTLIARTARSNNDLTRDGRRKVPLAWVFAVERVTGIEPALSAWEADVLPLNYTRAHRHSLAMVTVERVCAVFAQTSYRTR